MKTLKNILNYKNIIFPTSLITAIVLSFTVVTPTIAKVKQGMDTHANCVNTVFPDNVERDIVVDADAGLIYVGYEENGVRKDVTLNLDKGKDSKFSECTNGVQELVTLAKKYSDKIDADDCKEFKSIVSSKEPALTRDGKKMDLNKAQNFINKHCK